MAILHYFQPADFEVSRIFIIKMNIRKSLSSSFFPYLFKILIFIFQT